VQANTAIAYLKAGTEPRHYVHMSSL
jgi:hypothetical protein